MSEHHLRLLQAIAEPGWRDATDSELSQLGITQPASAAAMSETIHQLIPSNRTASPKYSYRHTPPQWQTFAHDCTGKDTALIYHTNKESDQPDSVTVLLKVSHQKKAFAIKVEVFSAGASVLSSRRRKFEDALRRYKIANRAERCCRSEISNAGSIQPHQGLMPLLAFNVSIREPQDIKQPADVRIMLLMPFARLGVVCAFRCFHSFFSLHELWRLFRTSTPS